MERSRPALWAAVVACAAALVLGAVLLAERSSTEEPDRSGWLDLGADLASDEVSASEAPMAPVGYRLDGSGGVQLRGEVVIAAAPAERRDDGTYVVDLFAVPCDQAPDDDVVINTTVRHQGSFVPALLYVDRAGGVALLADATIVRDGTVSAAVPFGGVRFQAGSPGCEP